MFRPRAWGEIVNERQAITADTAIRLGRYFKTMPRFRLIFKPQTKTANQNRKPRTPNPNCRPQTANDLELIEGGALAQIESEVRPQA
jgi:plasmid maintenance system antidote protein VapI